ncbi:MAG: MBL fold metallo-hydrolase, partial [Rhodanobacteraceae bacterium]
MAELTFVGAAGTVTGSKHLLETGGHHVLVDCGLFQGTADVTALNAVALPVAASDVEAVIVTHGHIDHVGYVPKLVKDGFTGAIYCTPATAALMQIV